MNMKIIISPAKKIESNITSNNIDYSAPNFLKESKKLVEILKEFSPDDLSQLMNISKSLGLLNADRYLNWSLPFNQSNSKQAILCFKGDVYKGINTDDFNNDDFEYAQSSLRIISGLYGILKPLDLIMPYRLEMGTKLNNAMGNNLYKFWGDILSDHLSKEILDDNNNCLINLASNEYSKAIKINKIKVPVITPIFKDYKNGKLKVISFYAKKARGNMCRYIIKNKINTYDQLYAFNEEGYVFNEELSSLSDFVYIRS